jgi:hypothetical protein
VGRDLATPILTGREDVPSRPRLHPYRRTRASSTTTLGHDRSAFVIAEATEQIQAIGQVFPRVQFELRLRTPNERVQAEIHQLRLRVKFANEVLGEGTSGGEYVDANDRRMRVEVPISRSALAFVNENLQVDRLDLTLSLQGWMRIRREPPDGASEPPAEWTFTSFGVMGMADITLQIARGEWFKRVLEPLGSYEYVLTEMPILKGNTSAVLQRSLAHIREAERHFAEGNDPAVFQYYRAMIEALPGWPTEIFANVPDTNKAGRLNELTLAAKRYYDHGRHLAKEGAQEGDFPVNHREALFAINMAKVLLAEIAAVIRSA